MNPLSSLCVDKDGAAFDLGELKLILCNRTTTKNFEVLKQIGFEKWGSTLCIQRNYPKRNAKGKWVEKRDQRRLLNLANVDIHYVYEGTCELRKVKEGDRITYETIEDYSPPNTGGWEPVDAVKRQSYETIDANRSKRSRYA